MKTCGCQHIVVTTLLLAAAAAWAATAWTAGRSPPDSRRLLRPGASRGSSIEAEKLLRDWVWTSRHSLHDPQAWATTLKWFPQVKQCPLGWMQQYSQRHADIAHKRLPQEQIKWLVSVSAEAGLADRLSGLLTLFWAAVLNRRALTEVAYDPLPAFSAACNYPWVNWTHPETLPPAVVDPLKYTYQGVRGYGGDRSYNKTLVNTDMFYQLFLVTHLKPSENRRVKRTDYNIFFNSSMAKFPASQPDVPYVLAGANRGRTFKMASSRFHKQEFWHYGVTADNAFMCGFFFLCSPNNAVQQLYQKYWEVLRQPGILSIGIQVRFGDRVMHNGLNGTESRHAQEIVSRAEQYFSCAEQLEKAYALPGQKVVWFLNSDSDQLRKAARLIYGDKLLTDMDTNAVHVDCKGQNSKSCDIAAMDAAMQHALGAMLTFSMTQYQVITVKSGFGRVPAFLSGQWDNVYEMAGKCKVTRHSVAASHTAGVR